MQSPSPSARLRQQQHDYCPWFFSDATETEKEAQMAHKKLLAKELKAVIGERCFISSEAAIVSVGQARFSIGDDSFVAAQAYITGTVTLGKNCTVNPFVTLRENIVGGDGIRIGAYSCLVGANHGFADTEVPIWQQPHTSKGIRLGDDIWIGSHANTGVYDC